jgi:hypothetical protein
MDAIINGILLQQAQLDRCVGNPKGINCVPLLAGWLGYSYEIDPIQELHKKNHMKIYQSFNVTFCLMNAVNPKLETFCDVSYRELFRRIRVFFYIIRFVPS